MDDPPQGRELICTSIDAACGEIRFLVPRQNGRGSPQVLDNCKFVFQALEIGCRWFVVSRHLDDYSIRFTQKSEDAYAWQTCLIPPISEVLWV